MEVFEATLQPGEVLYIPPWWLCVLLGLHSAINQWTASALQTAHCQLALSTVNVYLQRTAGT